MDADGHSRGILTAWSTVMNRIAVVKHDSFLETKLRDGETGMDFSILNVYGPFFNRKNFWEDFRHT